MSKYYLISYALRGGFGNIFYEVLRGELNIRDAEIEIQKRIGGQTKPVIITINKINKSQYIPSTQK